MTSNLTLAQITLKEAKQRLADIETTYLSTVKEAAMCELVHEYHVALADGSLGAGAQELLVRFANELLDCHSPDDVWATLNGYVDLLIEDYDDEDFLG